MIELSRTQDEEVGDGTTSVIVLGMTSLLIHSDRIIDLDAAAGEILAQSLPLLERNIHPVVIIAALNKALKESLDVLKGIAVPINTSNDEEMLSLIKTSIGTKFVIRWSDLMCKLALDAIRTVTKEDAGIKTIDIKRYARVEKVPGGEIEQSQTLDGIMVNKDVTHPAMRRRIVNPRIILLDCPLEYKKGESQTNMEISKEADWARAQEIEEEQVKSMCQRIMEFKPDLIFTEKGISGVCFSADTFSRGSAKRKMSTQISRSTSCYRRTSQPSAECASRTTTASRAPSAQPS
jgi:T-complex protein 1 subunit gamma